MRKKIAGALASVLIAFAPAHSYVHAAGNTYITQQVSFIDIHNDYWAGSAILDLAKTNVISGYEDNTFKPENPVTREEFASLVAKTFYLDLPESGAKATYYDVSPDRWSFPYIEASREFLTGYYPPSGKAFFSPTLDATREDVAVTLVKTLGYTPDDLRNPRILENTFRDVNSISPNLKTYVALAVEKQLFSGYPDQTFKGDKQVTRAEVATLLYKIIKNASADGHAPIQLNVNVPETTSNGTFYVSGETSPGATVTINNREVSVVQGQFKEGLKINQGEGDYTVTVTARLPGGKSKTVTKVIQYEKGGPELTVNDIPEETDKQYVTVSWSVRDENDSRTVVYVNNEAQRDYSNQKKVELTEGTNTIVVKATNSLGKSTTVTKTIVFNTGGPVLKVNDIPDTTDKASVNVSWSVTDKNDSKPKVYINDEAQSEWSSSKTISLSEGANTIVFKATNSLGKSTTVTKTITLSTGGPVLKVNDIPDSTDKTSVMVSWSVTDKNDSRPIVYINDEAQSEWSSSKTIALNEGINTIVFRATNSLGKSTTVTKKISLGTGAPVLKVNPLPASTDSSTLNVSWTVTDKNDDSVRLFLNEKEYSKWQSSATLTLEPGENVLVFKAVNANGKETVVSKTVTFNPPAPKLTAGYMPSRTTSSSLTVTWTLSDKNDNSPKLYVNDEFQSTWNSSKTVSLVKGANTVTLLAVNKYGKQTTVTNTVYKD
ncbi:S-layer homology domain-containing protein [Paenibacillus hodogayensis]|uniref:S-layer homology domain-containing protein n=1 Tax=Paenibacillus hodogayensis TaxID=279208 RepID=A0ABV5VV25_9BACL